MESELTLELSSIIKVEESKGFALDDMPGVRDAVGPISSERGTRFVNGALGHVKREGKSVSLAMSVSFW